MLFNDYLTSFSGLWHKNALQKMQCVLMLFFFIFIDNSHTFSQKKTTMVCHQLNYRFLHIFIAIFLSLLISTWTFLLISYYVTIVLHHFVIHSENNWKRGVEKTTFRLLSFLLCKYKTIRKKILWDYFGVLLNNYLFIVATLPRVAHLGCDRWSESVSIFNISRKEFQTTAKIREKILWYFRTKRIKNVDKPWKKCPFHCVI